MSWITLEKWESLSAEQRKKFLPLCPDFAAELVSESDALENTRKKLQEYLDNGLKLGWLIVPNTKTVEIYRAAQAVEYLQSPRTLSGELVLPGLVVDLRPIWGQGF